VVYIRQPNTRPSTLIVRQSDPRRVRTAGVGGFAFLLNGDNRGAAGAKATLRLRSDPQATSSAVPPASTLLQIFMEIQKLHHE
jgi:hypothetical protein